MKIIIKCIPFILFFFFISACTKTIKGNGEESTEVRSLNPFTKIKANGQFNVSIIGGKPKNVTVTVDKNLQAFLLTEVKEDTLVISTKDDAHLSSNKPLLVAVYNPNITAIRANGDNNIKASDIV